MFASRNNQLLAGIGIAAVIAMISVLGYNATPAGSALNTFFFAIGGQMPAGLIQFATFAAFFVCLFGMMGISRRLDREEAAFGAKILPETEQYVLYPEDVNQLKLETIDVEKRLGATMLTDLIKQATTKFRAQHSTAETLSLVESVSEMQRKNTEKDFWMVHTTQTLIPTFGFLGTVLGMAAAIMSMGKTKPVATALATTPGTPGATTATPVPAGVSSTDISALIDNMGTAFFTTIVAIVLGIIVTVLLKRLEARVDDLHTGMKRYVVENLVNRIHL